MLNVAARFALTGGMATALHLAVALAPALLRFGLVSGLGFLANQMTLFLSLKSGLAGPGPALLAANACAALCSFMLSRFWVFR